ncbi:protein Asterix [Eurytemora carolleeae]|uniref:protein Asterix n=1 Tax=Eurytemora carolleeae TaxID=1294199 RepID=UPI000C779DD6|nr:protein Asterix [Eurytemora carolleeae]|eukprot:XP_023328384.1 protein Asterix-like [Eurytemora affinis]
MLNSVSDPRRPEFIKRYSTPQAVVSVNGEKKDVPGEDLTPDYMNVLGMIFSMCALMLRIKWCSWIAVYCSCVSFANTKYLSCCDVLSPEPVTDAFTLLNLEPCIYVFDVDMKTTST